MEFTVRAVTTEVMDDPLSATILRTEVARHIVASSGPA
jgi:hypothetical protein